MITYTCDICGKPMPADYRRPDRRRGRDSLPALCGADDVCPTCEQTAGKISVQRVLLNAWRDAVDTKDTAPQAPPSVSPEPKVLREHDSHPSVDVPDGELKRKVAAQVKAYRDAHGLGCFGKLAQRIQRKGISDAELRDILNGSVHLDMADWRRISTVMDRIEAEEASNA